MVEEQAIVCAPQWGNMTVDNVTFQINNPADKGLPSMVSNKMVAKTTPFPKGLHGDKDSEESKPPVDTKPQTNPVADLLGTGAEYQVDEIQSTRLRY
nr:hypothetical protein [Tanacetum cinerariifolium]